jgi:D-alanine-D-alanine ligase
MKERKFDILVLAGGESAEREVSLSSAGAVAESLLKSGHRIRVIDTFDGKFLTDQSGRFIADSDSPAHPENALPMQARRMYDPILAGELARVKQGGVDLVFNALHGGAGENGIMQALLDLIGIPYTGSPTAASAVAMNKDISKRIMKSLDIPTAEWMRFDRPEEKSMTRISEEIKNRPIRLPLIVKPCDGGSTVGLTLVETGDRLSQGVEAAFAVSDSIIIERYLKGREITIAVLDGQALPPVEIRPSHKLYDYTCKYTSGKSQYVCPAEIDDHIVRDLSDDAVLFYKTIGCRGYARVDFIVASDGEYICLELNTLPGMTELSLFPMAARAAGLEFDRLLEKLCHLALEGR